MAWILRRRQCLVRNYGPHHAGKLKEKTIGFNTGCFRDPGISLRIAMAHAFRSKADVALLQLSMDSIPLLATAEQRGMDIGDEPEAPGNRIGV